MSISSESEQADSRAGSAKRRWLYRGVAMVAAALIFAVPWEYCMDGNALGIPMAWLHPGHGEWGTVPLSESDPSGKVIDLPNLAASLVLWLAIVTVARFWATRRFQVPG